MKLLDLSGQRFGHLAVIARADSRRTYRGQPVTHWTTRCDCGSVKVVSSCNLKEGRSQTCGLMECSYHRAKLARGAANGSSGFRQAVRFYRGRAKSRGLEFSLSEDELSILFQSQCFYCGASPSNTARRESSYGVYLYTGIDRVDSGQGYTASNVRPACWVCNAMKSKLHANAFLSHVRQIVKHRANGLP